MKNYRRLLSTALAIMMVIVMMVPTFAADPYSITVRRTSTAVTMAGSSYTAYKVFDVEYNAGKTAYNYTIDPLFSTLSYDGATGAALPAKVATYTSNTDKLNGFAKAVRDYISTNPKAYVKNTVTATAADSVTIPLAQDGYYIVLAEAKAASDQDIVTALCALGTTDPNVTVDLKVDAPTVDKKVQENSTNLYGKVADYKIGDTVPFRIEAKIPKYSEGYTNYTYEIHDTMQTGLTLNAASIKLYTDEAGTLEVPGANYTTSVTGNNYKMVLTSAYAKSQAGKSVFVKYTATLDKTANIYTGSNDNEVFVRFSNNPYATTTEDTPKSLVKVYTYKFDIFKYTLTDKTKADSSANRTALTGAEFEIYTDAAATANRLNLVAVAGATDTYRVALPGETTGIVTKVVSPATGMINIQGLDATTYYLKEIKAPEGYNVLAAPVSFTINATKNQTEGTVTAVNVNGSASTQLPVLNQTGTLLPTTGGMGTVIFYVAGLGMMIGAAVLLITKKRLASK